MPLDFLFRRSDDRRPEWKALREPFIEPPRRIEIMPPAQVSRPALPAPVRPGAPMPDSQIEVRAMTPRQMADWAHDMYMTGWIDWDDYRAAIPAELLPGFDATIGALIGETADPDRPRDMVREWEDRLAFTRRYSSGGDTPRRQAERIVSLLKWQDSPHMDA